MLKRRTPLQRGSRKLRPVSAKKVKLNRIYKQLSHDFLIRHPFCQHWIAECGLNEEEVIKNNGWYKLEPQHPLKPGFAGPINQGWGRVPPAVEIHHKRGRGRFFLDTSTWMAVRFGHSVYIHGKPAEAYAKGYMLPR